MIVEVPNTEIVVEDTLDVSVGSCEVEVVDLADLDVTVSKKEYVITGDEVYIPMLYDDAPQWMKDLVQVVVDVAVDSSNQGLVNDLNAIVAGFATSYVPLNQYTQSIVDLSDEDGRLNALIETLNSNFSDGLSSANAQIASLQLTKASKDEVVAQVIQTIAAQLADNSSNIGATIGRIDQAIADETSARASSFEVLSSSLEDTNLDVTANATATSLLNTYVGLELGTPNGTGLLADVVALASDVTTLSTELDNGTNTWASADSVLENSLMTEISEEGTRVESKFAYNSIVGINGVYKKSGFGLTTNYVSGSGTEVDPYVSEFWIDASRLKFTNSNQTGQVSPFTIDATGANPVITFNGKVQFSDINNVPTINKTYVQASQPTTGMNLGDTWIDTDDNNSLYSYNGTTWNKTQSGNKTFLQTTAPTTGMIAGDIWVDSDNNYKQYRYNGSAWVEYLYNPATAINAGITTINGGKITTNSITATQIAADSISADRLKSTTGSSTVWDGGGLVSANFNGNVTGNIGSPTMGFRLSSNAAGTLGSNDPNIYGAYIQGSIIDASSSFITSSTANPANTGPAIASLNNPTLYGPLYGSGYISSRFTKSTSYATVLATGTQYIQEDNPSTTYLQYNVNNGNWNNLDTIYNSSSGGNLSTKITLVGIITAAMLGSSNFIKFRTTYDVNGTTSFTDVNIICTIYNV